MKKPTIRLNKRDYLILKLIYEYRFLSGDLLWYLIKDDTQSSQSGCAVGADGKRRPISYGFKRQALSKRLKRLFDEGYVTRHYVTDEPQGRGYGTPRAIYGLGQNSPKVLFEFAGIPVSATKKMIESNGVKSPFLRHALEVAAFKVTLMLACEKIQGKVTLLFWEQGESIRETVFLTDRTGEKIRLPVHADAFFGLGVAGKKKKHFFLEIDRGTEPIVSKSRRSNIRRKLIGYQIYRKSKQFITRYSGAINGFQVLLVTPGQIGNTGDSSGRVANISKEILSQPRLYTSKSLFLLTTPDSFGLEVPLTIFSKIWISPNRGNSVFSLIE
ncbi:hypothetical protein DRQ05_01515 [bacterium]|nr:MAG: hypothetical protein DRQ05_01515 [bacterium]